MVTCKSADPGEWADGVMVLRGRRTDAGGGKGGV